MRDPGNLGRWHIGAVGGDGLLQGDHESRAMPVDLVEERDLVVVVLLVAPVVDPLALFVVASKRSGAGQQRAANLGRSVGLHERFRGGDSAAQGEHVLLGVAGSEGGLLREVVILAEDVARAEWGSTQDMLGGRVALHGAHAVGDRGSPREGRLQLVTGMVLLVDRELLTANLMVTLHEREGVVRAAGHDGEADAAELAPVLHELAHVAAAGVNTEHFRCAGPSDPVALQRAALGFGFLVLHRGVEGEPRTRP